MSYRRLGVLIRHLPVDSSLHAVLPPAEPTGEAPQRPRWSVTDYLLADVHDVLSAANWQRAGDKHSKHPRPYPRPDEQAQPRGLTQAQVIDLRRRTGRS